MGQFEARSVHAQDAITKAVAKSPTFTIAVGRDNLQNMFTPCRRCAVATLAAALLLGLTSSGRADPLRLALKSRVSPPERPSITLTADEPVSSLSLALEPAESADGQRPAESAPQTFRERHLSPGKSVTWKLGTGRGGATHWRGMLQLEQVDGKLWKRQIDLTTEVQRKLEITFDPNYFSSHISLEKRYVEVQLSVPAERGEIEAFGDDGSEMGSGSASFGGQAAHSWLRLSWDEKGKAAGRSLLRLAITLHDTDGNFVKIDLYPWAVQVPHEEVNFPSGSAEIEASERGKLDESLRKIKAVIARVESSLKLFKDKGIASPPSPKLFVAGHTDTVGGDGDNLTLSRNRARAIAAYFQKQGLPLQLHFVGFGERQLRVKTADNVDEVRNRRADYTLALDAPPLIAGLAWQRL
jgi:hypothetical protein